MRGSACSWRWLLATAVVLAILAQLPISALASVGAGVGASPIILSQPAQPGHSYQLPSLYVINTGTDAAYYQARVQAIGQNQGQPVPPGWVRFGRNHFQLLPKQALAVPITLSVPSGALAGSYRSYLVAGTVPESQTSGVAFGAAAATRLEFTVQPAPGFAIPWPWAWWVYLLLGLVVLAGGSVLLLKLLGLNLQIERRR